MTIVVSKAAEDDLTDIAYYGLESYGLAAAQAYVRALTDRFDLIEANPAIGRLRSQMGGRSIHTLVWRAHVIIYELGDDDAILIQRVVSSRSDWLAALD